MSAALEIPCNTQRPRLDEILSRLRESASVWAARPIAARIALARSMLHGSARVAERVVAAACVAKGLTADTPPEGEEWLSSPYVTNRILRQTLQSLIHLEREGNTPVGRT